MNGLIGSTLRLIFHKFNHSFIIGKSWFKSANKRSQLCMHRSSLPEVFCKKGVLKNFAKFTGKHLCRAQLCNVIKKRLQHRFFSVKFTKFLRAPFFTEHLRWLFPLVEMLRLHVNLLLIFGLGEKFYQSILVGMYINVALFSREQQLSKKYGKEN